MQVYIHRTSSFRNLVWSALPIEILLSSIQTEIWIGSAANSHTRSVSLADTLGLDSYLSYICIFIYYLSSSRFKRIKNEYQNQKSCVCVWGGGGGGGILC